MSASARRTPMRASLDVLTVRAYPRAVTPKPGWKTTEFWSMVFVALFGVLNATGALDYLSQWHGGIVLTIAVAFYNVARGIAKRPS